MKNKYKRWAIKSIEHALKTRRIIVISGPRQCGKTTLSKQAISSENLFRTLDDSALLTAAIDDPQSFIERTGNKIMVIDEIQKAPILLPAIKKAVDENTANGQYVLTGSANIQTLPEVTESLAGRVRNIRLRTLTQGEIAGKEPDFLAKLFTRNFPAQIKGCCKEKILSAAFRGGYPEAVLLPSADRKDWHKDYINSLLSRDLKEISNIRRVDILQDLVAVLAAWSAKFMDISGICSSFSVSKPTLKDYINSLESLFLFEKLRPWIKTDYDRVGKTEKWYITDTGLMSNLLNWREQDLLIEPDKSGKLVETFVFNELSALIALENDCNLYQYRDRTGHEIDFIIENGKGELAGIEVKSGSLVGKTDFKHLHWFKDHIAKEKPFMGIVLYSGENTLSFGDGMLAVPTATLWT